MLAHLHPQTRPHRTRKGQRASTSKAAKSSANCSPPPFATKETHVIAGSRHEQQIGADDQQRRRLQTARCDITSRRFQSWLRIADKATSGSPGHAQSREC
jgi:hypothetical protein